VAKATGLASVFFKRRRIEQYEKGFLIFGCGSPDTIIAVPSKKFLAWLEKLNVTDHEDAFYWHVHIIDEGNRFFLKVKKGGDAVELTEFLLK
jgi:hypothetical protein